MEYTITNNAAFGSLEISFPGKPSAAVRDALKALKFRWHGVKKVWYGYADADTVRAAIAGEKVEAATLESKPKAEKKPAIDKDLLRREFSKAWSSQKMIDFCVNKTAAYAVLPDGGIVTVDKQGIEKDFCFGESGYDYDEAQAAAAHARKSESYFKSENMKYFKSWLESLKDAKSYRGRELLIIYPTNYTGQEADCRLRSASFERLSKVLDAMGGSACIEDLPGKELTIDGRSCKIATPEEIAAIEAAYAEAAKVHERKIDSYLKRYGTSKVNSWTYWRDA